MAVPASDKVDLLFRAFADRTRLRILHLLRTGDEICVCDLMAVLGLPQAKVSRHLAYLRRAGLVAGRRQRQWMHYRLLPPRGPLHASLIACLASCATELRSLRNDSRRLARGCDDAANSCC
jgi:ArsR family transcriptional regulator, arsenate/arsenite/antimonite-responsive transcriptional repressor